MLLVTLLAAGALLQYYCNARLLYVFISSERMSSSLAAVLAHTTSGLTAVDVHRRLLLLLRLLGVDNALLNVAREAEEGLLDVDVGLGADFHEGNAELVGERLALLGRNRALLFPVALVANEDFVDAFGGVLLDVGEPGADVCEERISAELSVE